MILDRYSSSNLNGPCAFRASRHYRDRSRVSLIKVPDRGAHTMPSHFRSFRLTSRSGELTPLNWQFWGVRKPASWKIFTRYLENTSFNNLRFSEVLIPQSRPCPRRRLKTSPPLSRYAFGSTSRISDHIRAQTKDIPLSVHRLTGSSSFQL